ncbi:hypothetical protein EOPP23_09590 [Endozoicomonas sp. OPT23]|uniref:hypothetical protein n=1 Tax=Endozoicomonas sp. OPT23 TaxID=2072845 RepID=UPI00129B03D1|nr:hypothetical protein [Endozoicomonas sp. OPT23]MRI33233.1 hypothetical protein [Endozoicomonas sp. OPT23]
MKKLELSLEQGTFEKLQKLCRGSELSVSDLCNFAIEEFLREAVITEDDRDKMMIALHTRIQSGELPIPEGESYNPPAKYANLVKPE